ncbi:MAG: zf-HC2 domain-containing protein [Candidatus Thiodiazotropha sp.]
MSVQQTASNHEQQFLNLPWYVNGTLSAEQMEAMRLHIDGCDICRQEVELLRSAQSVVQHDLAAAMPDTGRLDRLMEKIDGLPRQAARPVNPVGMFLQEARRIFSALFENRWAWAAVVPILLVAVIFMRDGDVVAPGIDYKTLSSDERPAGSVLRLRFETEAGVDAVELMHAVRPLSSAARLETGTDGGYVVALPSDTAPDRVLAVMQLLEEYPGVDSVRRTSE